MKEKEIKKLIKIVEESNIAELEVSRWGRKVRIRKWNTPSATVASHPNIETPPVARPVEKEPLVAEETGLIEIKSPMVGTFYRAPAPDADPYVEVGDIISSGQVLCIIEAMKLMNEIEAEYSGRIVEILVENAQPVEYNQPLFRVGKI